jgi:hypothetical protein
MSGFSSLRVATRMQILVGLALIGLLALCLTALFQLKTTMMEDRKQKTRNLVEVSIGIVTHHHKLASAGKLSEEEAKNAARDSLRTLRYGKDDYFFGFDTSGVYFLNGGNPAIEGQQKIELKDTNGKFLIKELIGAAQAGGGFVDYWFPRAGQQTAEPQARLCCAVCPLGLGTRHRHLYRRCRCRIQTECHVAWGNICCVACALEFRWLAGKQWHPEATGRRTANGSRGDATCRCWRLDRQCQYSAPPAACCMPSAAWCFHSARCLPRSMMTPIAW